MAGKSDYFFNNLLAVGDHNKLTECSVIQNDFCRLNIDSESLEMIITFCYSGAVELTIDNVEYVLIGAIELQIDSLIVLCSQMLDDLLCINNCIRFLEIADKYNLMDLRDNSLSIVAERLPNVNKLPEFYHLDGSQMFWLIELLSKSKDGIFDDLLKSLNDAENVFPPHLLASASTHSAIRAAVSISVFFLLLSY